MCRAMEEELEVHSFIAAVSEPVGTLNEYLRWLLLNLFIRLFRLIFYIPQLNIYLPIYKNIEEKEEEEEGWWLKGGVELWRKEREMRRGDAPERKENAQIMSASEMNTQLWLLLGYLTLSLSLFNGQFWLDGIVFTLFLSIPEHNANRPTDGAQGLL